MPRAVCLLHLCRRTFLLILFLVDLTHRIIYLHLEYKLLSSFTCCETTKGNRQYILFNFYSCNSYGSYDLISSTSSIEEPDVCNSTSSSSKQINKMQKPGRLLISMTLFLLPVLFVLFFFTKISETCVCTFFNSLLSWYLHYHFQRKMQLVSQIVNNAAQVPVIILKVRY